MPVIKKLDQRKILLDTHVWLWLMMGEKKLSSAFRKSIDHLQTKEAILISSISIWEVGMLVEKKRIKLEMDRLEWVEECLSVPGIHLASISPRIAIQSTRLPEEIHGDPADRILIATAREKNAVLVTADQKILDYGKGRFIHVYDPTASKN